MEGLLPNTTLLSLRLTAPLLFALGSTCAFFAQLHRDYAAIAVSLCLCVCAAALLAEDLLQESYRRDRAVLVYVASHPGAIPGQASRALGITKRRATRDSARLTRDGLLFLVEEVADPLFCSYRLATHRWCDGA
ncbi:MarR family transcriptional regulator [Streptomyces sp. NPDC058279]|uniref:MarR family transcriptional regulator n=1 Tax=Streptomyces sp. NPDC058279 TaxID=3346418 RepID=UPI0036E0D92D